MPVLPKKKTAGHSPRCRCTECTRKAKLARQSHQTSEAMLQTMKGGDALESEKFCTELEELNAEAANL